MKRSLSTSSWIGVFACAVWSVFAAPSHAAEGPVPCRKYEERSPGVYIQRFDSTEVTGGIAGLPDRITTDLSPGQSGTVCVGFQNRTGVDATLEFQALDFGASVDGLPSPSRSGDEDYGAGSWLTLPTDEDVTIEHGDLVWLEVDIEVPLDTAGGSSYAGVSALAVDRSDSEVAAPQAKVSPSVIVQVFFDVPGDITQSGELTDVRSPRLIWWDGLDIGKIPVLDKMRGSGIAPVRFSWRNTGSVSDDVGARLVIESSLGGKTVADIEVPERIVMRDSERAFDVTWSKDIPFVGRFEPTLVTTRSDGTTEEHELPAIWVIPSWWYILALLIAIALPLWWRRRSRRKYDDLVARVEAAESRAAGEDDWDDRDEWSR